MGILASDQITITDVTDGYAVILTSETYTFVENSSGGTKNQNCTTEVVAYCGSNQCSAVNVSEKDIVCPTGITAEVSNSGSSKVKIAFKTSANLTGACEATIPVVVDGIIVNKKFSFAVAKAGAAGSPGKPGTDGQDGIDGIAMSVTASHGTIFKTNTGNTVLTAHIFNGGVEQPIDGSGICGDLGTVKWYKAGTSSPISASGSITAVASDITTTVTYTVQLENSDGVKATTQITISKVIDVYAVTRYYMLQSSSFAAPSKPTVNPPAGWSDTEPSYVSGSTNTLYFVDCNVYSDKTFSFSEVSKSSTYEAAKDAWNKANKAQESIDNLEIGGRNLIVRSKEYTEKSPLICESYLIDGIFQIPKLYMCCKKGQTYTFQFKTNGPFGDHITDGYGHGVTHVFLQLYANGDRTNIAKYTDLTTWCKTNNKDTGLGTYVYTIPTDQEYDYITFRMDIHSDGSKKYTYKYWDFKAEKGNKATDWTPAPEDAISQVDIEYYLSDSATSLSGGSWTTLAPEWVDGKFMWSRTVTADGVGNKTYSPNQNGVCIAGATGNTGATGKGIKSIGEEYYKSTSATSLTGGAWARTYPGWENGKYIWTRSVTTYTDNTTDTTTPICVTGEKGTDGKDGFSPTVSVSKSGNTTTISITDKTGTHTQTVKDGTNGTPGTPGSDGRTPYIHVKYSDDGGKTFTSNSGETVGDYIGICTDYKVGDPGSVSSYTWAKIKGNSFNWNLLTDTHETAQTYNYPSNNFADYSWYRTPILNGSTYTLSFLAKSTVAGDVIRCHFYDPSNITSAIGSQGQHTFNSDGQIDFVLSTEWTRYWVTYTIPVNGNSSRGVIFSRMFSDAGTGTVSVMHEKVEEGSEATAWSKAESEYKGDKGDKGPTGPKGETGAAGKDAIIISSTAPASPKTGQLWQIASGEPIKRWDGSKWVLHYISVENLDVQKLSAIAADLGTVTAGVIKNKAETVNIDVENGLIETYDDTFNSRSVYESGTSQYFGKDPATNVSVVTIDYNGIRHSNAAMGTTTMLTPKDKDWWIGDNPWYDYSNALPIRESLETLLNKDSVVAQGTSGIWFYRKWASGFAECIGTQDFSFNQTSGKVCMLGGVNYPFTFKAIISKIKYVTYTSGSKIMFATSGGKDSWSMTDTGYTSIMADANYIDTQTGKISYIIKGKWK